MIMTPYRHFHLNSLHNRCCLHRRHSGCGSIHLVHFSFLSFSLGTHYAAGARRRPTEKRNMMMRTSVHVNLTREVRK